MKTNANELVAIRHGVSGPYGRNGYTVVTLYDLDSNVISAGLSLQHRSDRYSKKMGRTVALERARKRPLFKIDAASVYGDSIITASEKLKRLVIEHRAASLANNVRYRRTHYIRRLGSEYGSSQPYSSAGCESSPSC